MPSSAAEKFFVRARCESRCNRMAPRREVALVNSIRKFQSFTMYDLSATRNRSVYGRNELQKNQLLALPDIELLGESFGGLSTQ
jgi:hypothetical protein